MNRLLYFYFKRPLHRIPPPPPNSGIGFSSCSLGLAIAVFFCSTMSSNTYFKNTYHTKVTEFEPCSSIRKYGYWQKFFFLISKRTSSRQVQLFFIRGLCYESTKVQWSLNLCILCNSTGHLERFNGK